MTLTIQVPQHSGLCLLLRQFRLVTTRLNLIPRPTALSIMKSRRTYTRTLILLQLHLWKRLHHYRLNILSPMQQSKMLLHFLHQFCLYQTSAHLFINLKKPPNPATSQSKCIFVTEFVIFSLLRQ